MTFASLVATTAGAFYVWWEDTVLPSSAAVAQSGLAAQHTGAPVDCNCSLAATPVEAAPQPADDLADLDVEAEADFEPVGEAVADAGSKSIQDILEEKKAAAESIMFQSRITGPYALSIRDNLNEMVIGTYLAAEGLGDQRLDRVLNSVPSQLPTHGYVSSGFGTRRSPFNRRRVHHNGVDFAVPRGSPVYATADGEVIASGWSAGLGKLVVIDHGYGIVTRYGHNSVLVAKVGDHVQRGEIIAKAGSTGRSTGSHVHYEVWINDHAIDPARFMFDIPGREATAVAMDPYSDRKTERSLGLAMGGDGTLAPRLKNLQPKPDIDRAAGNIGIMGLFALGVFWLAWTLIPKKRIALRRH